MSNKESVILLAMNRLNLATTCNGLTTYAVLEEIWNEAEREKERDI